MLIRLSETFLRRLASKMERQERIIRGLDILLAAMLMSIVATFDSNVADIVCDIFKLKVDFIKSGSKTIPLTEILQADSMEELKEKIIDDEIYQFSRGSHEDQVRYIEDNFHIKIVDTWKRWLDFIKIFERCNLVAHGEKFFTNRYVSICKRHGHKGSHKVLGAPIELSFPYLNQAADLLLEFCALLVFSLWRKHFPEQESDAFTSLNQLAYKLIENRKYLISIRIFEYALVLKNVRFPNEIRKMMVVNLASAHRHKKEEQKCREILDEVDWSATFDNFKICVAALRGEVKEVVRLMPLVAQTGSIEKSLFESGRYLTT